MNEWYFFQDQGKTVGPYSLQDMRERIREGQVRVFDMIYKDGEPEWRVALEHTTLRGEFQASTLASLREKPWVVLRRKGGADFVTTGPFSQDEIRYEIQRGKISYSDYAWKDGLHEWRRIGVLEEFNPRVRTEPAPPVPELPQDTSADLLKNIVELRRPNNAMIEEVRPSEAGDDLLTSPPTKSRVPLPPIPDESLSRLKTPPAPAPPPSQVPARESSEARAKRVKKKHLLDWGMVGVLILVLAGMMLIVSRLRAPKPLPAPQVETAPVKPPPEKAQAQADEGDEEESDAAPQGHEPKDLVLLANVTGNKVRIELRSDGSAEYPVYVQVIGYPGQVTEGGAFYSFVRYVPTGDALRPLDLSNLKLPSGKFLVRAETGNLKKEARFTLGQSDPQYKTALIRQRKLWSQAIWHERLTLWQALQAFEKQAANSLGLKKFVGKEAESLKALSKANSAGHLLFEDWWELHQVVSEVKDLTAAQLQARLRHEHERLAALSVWK